MNGQERVKAIVDGEPVDRCAYWTGKPHDDTWEIFSRHFGFDTVEELYLKLGDDIRWIWVGNQELAPEGCFADCETAAEVDAQFKWPNPDEIEFTSWLEKLEQADGYYRLSGNLSMFFHGDCFCGFGGMQHYFTKMYTHPEVVHAVTRRACDYYLKLNRRFFKEATGLMEAYKVSHDLGTQLGLMVSPAMLEEFVFPYLQEQIDLGHDCGYKVVLHCCGAIRDILPRIIEMGVDLLHPIQANAMGMDAESLVDFKDRLTFIGGIDTQELLVHGSPADIRAEVRRVANLLGPLVISPSHEAILPDVPPDNIVAIAEAVAELV